MTSDGEVKMVAACDTTEKWYPIDPLVDFINKRVSLLSMNSGKYLSALVPYITENSVTCPKQSKNASESCIGVGDVTVK